MFTLFVMLSPIISSSFAVDYFFVIPAIYSSYASFSKSRLIGFENATLSAILCFSYSYKRDEQFLDGVASVCDVFAAVVTNTLSVCKEEIAVGLRHIRASILDYVELIKFFCSGKILINNSSPAGIFG